MKQDRVPGLADPLFPRLLPQGGVDVPDPFVLSLQSGLMVCGAVAAAVQLGLPDLLDETPLTVTQLAHEADADAPTLLLVLRALSSIGIFHEIDHSSHTFCATARSRALRMGAMGELVALWGAGYPWEAWQHLAYTVRTGRPALEVPYGEGTTIWSYFRKHTPPSSVTAPLEGLQVVSWLDVAHTPLHDLPVSVQGVQLRWRSVIAGEQIVFHPETITARQVLAERNAERRRVLLERLGYEQFVADVQPEVLDQDQDAGDPPRTPTWIWCIPLPKTLDPSPSRR